MVGSISAPQSYDMIALGVGPGTVAYTNSPPPAQAGRLLTIAQHERNHPTALKEALDHLSDLPVHFLKATALAITRDDADVVAFFRKRLMETAKPHTSGNVAFGSIASL